MYLTREILDKHNACGQGVAWFVEHYPDGAELIEIINDKRVNVPFLHWGFQHLTVSEEERQAYYTRLKIDVPYPWSVYQCRDVSNSSYISDSEKVSDSSFVFGSKNVNESNNISHSKIVDGSDCVYNSFLVTNCYGVVDSKNITDSTNIVCSEFVVGSHGVFNGNMITDSNFVSAFTKGGVRDITDSSFIMSCSNLKNCLFCEGISDKEYHIFNKPVPPRTFEAIYKQMDLVLGAFEAQLTLEWPKGTVPLDTPRINRNVIKQFKDLPDDFWDWVATLPNYDPLVLYSIVFNSDKIKQ